MSAKGKKIEKHEVTHTPGPWEAYNGEVTTRQERGRSYRRIAVIQDYGIGGLPEVDEANARLIAAAPELLESLKDLVKQIQDKGIAGQFQFDAIEQTLDKAEGRYQITEYEESRRV